MSKNPYAQVALTYIRRPFSFSTDRALAFVAISIFSLGLLHIGQRGDRDLRFLTMAFVLLSFYFVMHMMQQFANSRAHLTPRFRRVHIVVAAAMAITATVILPAIITWAMGLQSIGLIALTAMIFGAILCQLLYPLPPLNLLMIVGMVAAWTPWGKIVLQQLVSGQFELQALGLFILGEALGLLGGIRLFRMNEDMPEYHAVYATVSNRMTGPRPGEAAIPSGGLRGWLAEKQAERNISRVIRHARSASASPWSRVCRWNVGMAPGSLIYFLVIFFLVTSLVTGSMMENDWRSANNAMLPMMIMLVLASQGIAFGTFWRWRVRMLARELLLPVARPAYVRQLGMILAIRQFQLWVVTSVAIVLWFLLAAGQSFPLMNLARLLAVFALLQPWFFSFGAWFSRYRSIAMFVGAVILAVYPAIIPLVLCAGPGPLGEWSGMSVPLAGIIAVFGLLITYDAYRRWLVADLD